jgi:hypothetical protein
MPRRLFSFKGLRHGKLGARPNPKRYVDINGSARAMALAFPLQTPFQKTNSACTQILRVSRPNPRASYWANFSNQLIGLVENPSEALISLP